HHRPERETQLASQFLPFDDVLEKPLAVAQQGDQERFSAAASHGVTPPFYCYIALFIDVCQCITRSSDRAGAVRLVPCACTPAPCWWPASSRPAAGIRPIVRGIRGGWPISRGPMRRAG